MQKQPATLIDGYKVDHRRQYPDKTEIILSNFTARSTRRAGVKKVVFFGLQYFLKEYLIKQWNEEFFSKPIDDIIRKFKRRIDNYLGPNQVGDQHIRDLHALGYIPLDVYALPEGTEHPLRVPSCLLYDTDGRFGWFTNYVETIFSTTVWGPCTSATTALQYKKLLTAYALETVGNTDFVQWQAHDFSFRGMFGLEAACMSGAAHLTCFTGTDTIPAIDFLEQYYNADCEKELIGGSVAATEHSVMCAGGAEDEVGTYRRLINEIYPTGIVSIVSDTWDYWNVICNTSKILKDDIMKRDGKVVFRPDTGDPVKIVCGEAYLPATNNLQEEVGKALSHGYSHILFENKYYRIPSAQEANRESKWWQVYAFQYIKEVEPTPELKGSIECLWEIFGGTITPKGYKQLDSHVGLIYGDSITLERAHAICEGLKRKGFASTNLVFGIGSYTYQYVTRDTDGYAVKATWAQIAGKSHEIFKKPKTDDGTKNSAKGLTAVFRDDKGDLYLKDQATWPEVRNCELKRVFSNGKLLVDQTLAEIRARLWP